MTKRNKLILTGSALTVALVLIVMTCCALFGTMSCSASTARTADSTAVTEQQAEAGPLPVTMLFVGDAMQHEAQLDAALAAGGGKAHDYSECFTEIAPMVKAADYAVANLEVPLGGGPKYRGYPNFSAPDAYAKALKDAGFDMMLTSNNHCLDSGDAAARRTLTALDSMGLDHVGTYYDAAQREKLVPFIKDINGIKFGFLNYTYGTNGIEPKAGMEVARIDHDTMAREIKKTRDAGADVVIVTVHWGIEYVLTENESQRKTAQALADAGADLIVGGHPHVVQPIKQVTSADGRTVPVIYSLGNLISNMKTADTQGGAWAQVTFTPQADGSIALSDVTYDTFFVSKPHQGHKNFRVIPRNNYKSLPSSQREGADIFERGANRAFGNNVGAKRAQ